MRAAAFAARKHRDQRRKGAEASPYINHPIAVANVLASEGGVSDVATLAAALLHDTVEDTETSPKEIEREFGPLVAKIVAEVTDDKALPKAERKRLQIVHAPSLSIRAKRVKMADKVCNLRDISTSPPEDWNLQRRREYFDWAGKVARGLRGASPRLDRVLARELKRRP